MIEMDILLQAYRHMCAVKHMAATYEANRQICSYVHSTSRGHEAIQLAVGMQLDPADYVSPYYRDESMLLGMGFSPAQLMLQLLAKADDPFTAGREYYAHPNIRSTDFPTIIHQSSATGMQAIPTTGIAQGLRFYEDHDRNRLRLTHHGEMPLVVCSLGDASITEGEVGEALQMAILKQLPILYLVQDNRWGISVQAKESRKMDAWEFAAGFPGLRREKVNGSDFEASYQMVAE
ncbi:thiamine pyrophosphate-dependent enzyme, partial [Flavihumibacter petaseus]